MRTSPGARHGDESRLDTGDVERAREEVFRIGTQLAASTRRSADDDLLPADATRVVRVAVGHGARGSESRPTQPRLEPGRLQPPGARWMGESGLDGDQTCAAPVHRQSSPARDATRVQLRVDPACLKRGDLREIEDVAHVDPRSCDLDPAEAVDGEVAEWMRRGGNRESEHGERGGKEREPLHAAYLCATGAHTRETF